MRRKPEHILIELLPEEADSIDRMVAAAGMRTRADLVASILREIIHDEMNDRRGQAA